MAEENGRQGADSGQQTADSGGTLREPQGERGDPSIPQGERAVAEVPGRAVRVEWPGKLLPEPPVEPKLSRVRMNAVVHGIFSVAPVIPGIELEEDWLAFRDSIFEGAQPVGGLEMAFTEQIASGLWRQMRLLRYEREYITASVFNSRKDLETEAIIRKQPWSQEFTPEKKEEIDRAAMYRLLPGESTLNSIIRYQGMLRREVAQAVRHLEGLQRERRKSGEMTMVREVFRGFGPRNGDGGDW